MQTSKQIKKCLKEGIVTTEMLSLAIYSFNKRAKNMRDNEREYRHHPEYRQEYYEKKKEYYKCKDELLSYVQPCEIHTVVREHWERDNFGWDKTFFIEEYLFYIVGDKSFHSPLPLPIGEKYKHLPVVKLDELETFGKEPNDLMSVQTARKILEGLRSGALRYVGNEITSLAA